MNEYFYGIHGELKTLKNEMLDNAGVEDKYDFFEKLCLIFNLENVGLTYHFNQSNDVISIGSEFDLLKNNDQIKENVISKLNKIFKEKFVLSNVRTYKA